MLFVKKHRIDFLLFVFPKSEVWKIQLLFLFTYSEKILSRERSSFTLDVC